MKTKVYYEISHPAVTVTVLIFSLYKNNLEVLLLKRDHEPFKDTWSIPGGLIRIEESLDTAARRILAEQTGLTEVFLEQLHAFGDPQRDPRERRISVAHYALLPRAAVQHTNTDTQWFPIEQLPELAFDHNQIVSFGLKIIKGEIQTSSIAHNLLPTTFRLSELQNVYEVILGEKIDKRNFRKKLFSLSVVESTGTKDNDGRHRPAMLYRFCEESV